MQATIKQGLKRAFRVGWCVLGCLSAGCGFAMAQEPGKQEKAAISIETGEWKVLTTSPGVRVVSQTLTHPGKLSVGERPKKAAEDWLADQTPELYEGRNMVDHKLVYISIGSATINATPSNKNYIDSRYLAFQRAELNAKAKTALFLGVDLTTERGASEREINPRERAALEEIVNTSPTIQKNIEKTGIKEDVYGLFRKSTRLAGAKLDKALEESGVDLAAEKSITERRRAEARAEKNRRLQLRSISETSVKAAACSFAQVQGTQVIQAFEGSYHGNYEVAVVTLWSLNLQRLVESMATGRAPKGLSRKTAKREVAKQLPKNPRELSCLTGVRAFVDEHGESVLLAFGQAGVHVYGGREDKAFELAGKKARLRAMSAIRTFMGERVKFALSEDLKEVLALYASEMADGQGDEGAQEYRSISQFQEKITAVAKRQPIRGLHGLISRELLHHFTGKPMVMEVMMWSPSAQVLSEDLKNAIDHGVDKGARATPPRRPPENPPSRKGLISSGQGADKDAW